MACQFSFQDFDHITQDLQTDQLTHSNSMFSFKMIPSMQQNSTDPIVCLPRGGVVVDTLIGPIQYGLPPETVKDSIVLGLEVPKYYIIPTQRFDKASGINVAEFEFPSYFNFFIKNQKINLICTEEAQKAIKTVFQETLLGPLDHKDLSQDFYHMYPSEAFPDFHKELSYFSRNPKNPTEQLTLDHLLSFTIFDPLTNVAEVGVGDIKVIIIKEDNKFILKQNGVVITTIKDHVRFQEKDRFSPNSSAHDIKLQDDVKEEKGMKVVIWKKDKGETSSMTALEALSDNDSSFYPPDFGVTVLGCSHGFDPKGSTSGYIFWIYGKGIMVDPPPFASSHIERMGIPAASISGVIISHCHADHDAGAFHKILFESRVEIITTRTIMHSFLRKYSAISGLSEKQLKQLFIFRPAVIGTTLNIYGAKFNFFYALHTIPCLGFEVTVDGKSIYFSGDTFYDPQEMLSMQQKGLLSEGRYKQLTSMSFKQDIILHEAGIPPIHTPQQIFVDLPDLAKSRLYLVHIAEKDVMTNQGLKAAKTGIENTLILIPSFNKQHLTTLRRLDLISRIDIFQNLFLQNIRWLIDCMVSEIYSPGTLIITEGMKGDKFYIIEYGIAKVYSNKKGSEQNLIYIQQQIQRFERFYKSGDYFGESAIIENTLRQANVQAVSELSLLTLEVHDFWFIFGDGFEGQGPIIQKLKKLGTSRTQKAFQIFFQNSVLSQFNPSQKIQAEMILETQEIMKDQIIWKAGDDPQFVFIVKKGQFQFQDQDNIPKIFQSGTFVGEVKAMYENLPLTTTVKAITNSQIFQISKVNLINFLDKNPGLHIYFLDFKYFE